MKKLRTNLRKEDIALSKGYMRWYRVVENEVRLFINERAVNNNKEAVNKIYWKDSRAELCIDSFDYSKNFYEKHKIINFDTLYEKRQYEVVAAFYSKVYKNEEDVFKYYNYPGKLDKKQYANYVKNCRKLSVYDTGVTPSYGEQLLTLVTCAYQTEEGRFVVVARRI